ncbi:MAG: histidine kinase dimerization/phosphoacceptor domain -containing protein, partial [Bacteroidota bacterium]
MIKTSDGFVWFGTNGDGLIRFDGKESIQFTVEDGLENDSVIALYEARDKTLWVSTRHKGVRKFNRSNLQNVYQGTVLDSVETNHFYEDDLGLWISTKGKGLVHINESKWNTLTQDDGLLSDTVWSVWSNKFGVWAFGQGGISHIDRLQNGIRTLNGFTTEKNYYRLTEDQNGVYWIATSNGFVTIDDGKISFVSEIKGSALGAVYQIEPTLQGNVMMLTEQEGFIIYDRDHFIHGSEENGFSDNHFKQLYTDRSKRHWFITEQNGVDYIHNQAILWFPEEMIGRNTSNSIFASRTGKLWMGGEDGLVSYNYDDVMRTFEGTQNTISERVIGIGQYKEEQLLLLTDTNELLLYHPVTGQKERIKISDAFTSTYRITDVECTKDNRIYLGTTNGLFVLYVGESDIPERISSLPDEYVLHISADSADAVLVSTARGLALLKDGEENTPEIIQNESYNKQVRYAVKGTSGDIWYGTTEGLFRYQPDAEVVIRYGEEIGLKSLNIQGLTFLDDSTLFVATSAGVVEMRIESGGGIQSTYFSFSNNEVGISVHHGAIAKTGKTIWFGSRKGLYSYTENSRPLEEGPDIYLTNISLNYTRQGTRRFNAELFSGSSIKQIEASSSLNSDENNLSFSFRAIDFSAPDALEYQYRLFGSSDETWTRFDEAETISLENLSSGSYEFQVQARDISGHISETPASFAFSVLPPFYLNNGFIFTSVLFLGLIVFASDRYRQQLIERKKLKRLVEEQTQNLQSALKEKEVLIQEVHHRIKNNLAVISGLLDLQRSRIQNQKAVNALVEAQNRVRSIAMIHEMLYKNESLSRIDF